MSACRSAVFLAVTSTALMLLGSSACTLADTDSATSYDTEAYQRDLPWEISTEQGEMVLPNIFYAEASENEQIMPTALGGHHQIDRLIYPTIGNPNLYIKADPDDSLLVVLRIEEELLGHLRPDLSRVVPDEPRRYLDLAQDVANRLSFQLVARDGREPHTTHAAGPLPEGAAGVIPIVPTEIQIHDVSQDLPAPFQRRRTLRVLFRQPAMAPVPAGLYDLRMELVRDGQLAGAADGRPLYEYQYNAVRVFEHAPVQGEYTVINVTDTQISMGSSFGDKTQPHLRSFVAYVNAAADPVVANAAFITFNGDLHNGGSPGGVREEFVATTYNEESKVILDALKELRLPIFLTVGNHDGMVSTGHVPGAVQELSKYTGLQDTVAAAEPKAWPDFRWEDYQAYRAATVGDKGGWRRDVVVGAHSRFAGARSFAEGWAMVPRHERNMVLYDGFHQWRRTYGPMQSTWAFGDNLYVNINSFELRQHRRSGWGMYTVNYGGGMSEVQLEWLDRQLSRAQAAGQDVVLLAHHDPRGGHKGHDHGYYFAQVDYRGIGQSAAQYLAGKVLTPVMCKLPNWALKDRVEGDCLHDGLQEWMRPEPEFDCAHQDRLADGRCDPALLDFEAANRDDRHLLFSGLEMVDTILTHDRARTLLLGHTHYHSLEMLQAGDELVPDGFALSPAEAERFAALEVANPVRAFSWAGGGDGEYDPDALSYDAIIADNAWFFGMLQAAARSVERSLSAQGRELAVVRFTCNADLTSQEIDGEPMMGFSVLHVSARVDPRSYDAAQVNGLSFYRNLGSGVFYPLTHVGLDRNQRLSAADPANPVGSLFD